MQRDLGMVVGVDTHKDSHSAALVDAMGALVAATDVGANRKGYRRLLEWARCRGPQRTWVVEGTGSYGAGLASFLAASGEVVFEGDRPQRRKPGAADKSDQLDAVKVAREALAREHHAVPRQRGNREAIRVLLSTREGAVSAYRQALNQLYALVVSAPEPIRERLIRLKVEHLVTACGALRSAAGDIETSVTVRVLRQVARPTRSWSHHGSSTFGLLVPRRTDPKPECVRRPGRRRTGARLQRTSNSTSLEPPRRPPLEPSSPRGRRLPFQLPRSDQGLHRAAYNRRQIDAGDPALS